MRHQAPAPCRTVALSAALAFAVAVLTVGTAGADWLVTKDGGRVETKGPWRVEGRRVVFTTQAAGTLASLRLADVDLPASERATAEAKVAAEATATAKDLPEPPRKPVRSFTDKDFSHSEPADEAGEAGGEAGEPTAAPPSTTVQVIEWSSETRSDSRQVIVKGVVRNSGTEVATAVAVTVRLIGEQGQLLDTREAQLLTRALRPGQDTTFETTFSEVVTFADAAFEVRSVPLLARPTPPEEPPASPSTAL